MANLRTVALAACGGWLLLAAPTTANARLTMRVSPQLSLEPALVTIQLTIEADEANRTLEVVAETPEYRRSSLIQLDGERAPKTSVFEFRDLPTGVYDVTGTLGGPTGSRASVARTFVVVPARGPARPR